jgi:membrane-bound lytic murein transglycosylase A
MRCALQMPGVSSAAISPGVRGRAGGIIGTLLAAIAIVVGAGCAPKAEPEYARPLPPGGVALRLLPPGASGPDLQAAWRARDRGLSDAIEASLTWFPKPSSQRFFPHRVLREGRVAEVDHAHAHASVKAFRELLGSSSSATEFDRRVRERFDLYESIGWDGSGTVLFTGYFAPEFEASAVKAPGFTAPLYRRPESLVVAEDGTPLGRRLDDGRVVPWPPRAELERSGLLDELELVWMRTPLDAYIVQVNGSARLSMTDGSVRHLGYGGKTDRPYFGLGRAMVEAGVIPENRLSLAAIREVHRRDPATVERLMARNENFVFFADYPSGIWPAGSIGVRVSERATIATDKKVYPPGGVVVADTVGGSLANPRASFVRFMLDQDTGGAIVAPGRADLFMGIGPSAETLAGGQYAEGRLHYLFLKPTLGRTAAK